MIGEFLDAAKEETITALRAELARLQQSQHAQQAADSALASLQQKIDSLQVSVMSPSFVCSIGISFVCDYTRVGHIGVSMFTWCIHVDYADPSRSHTAECMPSLLGHS